MHVRWTNEIVRSLGRLGAPLCVAAAFAGCADSAGVAGAEEELRGAHHAPGSRAALVARAVLPADTFAEGPRSGALIGRDFLSQPVQGVSAVLPIGDGTYWAMSDNGYGSLENSADYNLRVYRLAPSFERASGGDGTISPLEHFELRDPDGHIKFAITNELTEGRVLTGADFDIESFQRTADGTFWFGDEFGPFILHTDATGKLLEAPIPLPDLDHPGQMLRAPQNPFVEEGAAVRVMNAVKRHAELHGNHRTPVFSPWHTHVIDRRGGRDNEYNDQRDNLDAPGTPGTVGASGLVAANDEIFDVGSLRAAGYPVVTWTVNTKERMLELMALGVDGIISDRPDLLLEAAREFDGNGDGTPDLIGPDGLIDAARFDAQGHRGGRNLRPENTIPAMEVALDHLMTTLELDTGLTSDLVPVLYHDREFQAVKSRRLDGSALPEWIGDVTFAEIQDPARGIVNDGVFRGDPQSNDVSLSPVAVAFAEARGLPHAYAMPSLDQVFEFVEFYIDYYRTGPGAAEPDAELRSGNAARVRFNIETKLNPRHPATTRAPDEFVAAIGSRILDRGLADRADIQSFDFRTLLLVHEDYPSIRTVFLFGDFSMLPNGAASEPRTFDDDGTNLQPLDIHAPVTESLDDSNNTPWMAGLFWPYRRTALDHPTRVQGSGGFEGMAIDPDGERLYPLLEKPLVGGTPGMLLIHEFDIASRAYTGERYLYPLDARGVAIGDFTMFDEGRGLVIERDGTQGDLGGFKRIFEVELRGSGEPVVKRPFVDLLRIADPAGISEGAELTGDVGLGDPFAFPFVTIESVVVLGRGLIGVVNDNNYPFSVGRHVGAGAPDDTEFIVLRVSPRLSR